MTVVIAASLVQSRAMPPAAAQRLEQCCRVGIPIGLRLDQVKPRLLRALLGAEQHEIAGVAILPLTLRQIEGEIGRIGRARRCFQTNRVLFQGRQRIGDILERAQHGTAILFRRFDIGGLRRTLLVQQRTAIEYRRRQRRAQVPESGTRSKHLANRQSGAAGIRAQGDVRQPVRGGDSHLGAGDMQIRLRLQYVGTLHHECKLSGRSCGKVRLESSNVSVGAWLGKRPARTARR